MSEKIHEQMLGDLADPELEGLIVESVEMAKEGTTQEDSSSDSLADSKPINPREIQARDWINGDGWY